MPDKIIPGDMVSGTDASDSGNSVRKSSDIGGFNPAMANSLTADDAQSYNLGLTPVETNFRTILRVRFALFAIFFIAMALFLDLIIIGGDFLPHGSIFMPVILVMAAIVILLPNRIWRRWGYDMQDRQLRVVRGFLFFNDTIVPLSRVQHIDVHRGPLERHFNTATLIIHTAGTHNNTVELPGLTPEKANSMRDGIKDFIRQNSR